MPFSGAYQRALRYAIPQYSDVTFMGAIDNKARKKDFIVSYA
jgi:hypothetical protein